jgi:hypothetical protein
MMVEMEKIDKSEHAICLGEGAQISLRNIRES